jgi:hypothetical protein
VWTAPLPEASQCGLERRDVRRVHGSADRAGEGRAASSTRQVMLTASVTDLANGSRRCTDDLASRSDQ